MARFAGDEEAARVLLSGIAIGREKKRVLEIGWSAREPIGEGEVLTLYKRKREKVRPVDEPHKGGLKPGGDSEWRSKQLQAEAKFKGQGRYPKWIAPKFSTIARGSRLTGERIATLKVGTDLTPEERDIFLEILYAREAALAWDFIEKGRFIDEIEPPHVIPTVPHVPWQAPSFRTPKALESEVARMFKERMDSGALERSFGPYRNPWFLVPKGTSGKWRIVYAAQRINAVTIRDASLPPSADEFSELFAGYPLISLLDLFSGYDQCALAEESRDLTSFVSPFGLLRMTALPMGYTNGVQVFDRVIRKTLEEQIAAGITAPFIDDVGVKPRSRSRFINPATGKPEEVIPGVRRFVLESMMALDRVLADIERAGATISGIKSEFLKDSLKVVAYICATNGRSPEKAKIAKILDWAPCTGASDAKAFLGVCVYYRIWIRDFATRAAPIYSLFRKGVPFVWGTEQQAAMDDLKCALTSPPVLMPIDYETGGGIVLSVDSSLMGWGAILQQAEVSNPKRRHPSRFESGIWSSAEKKYDSGKLECRGLLRALKKLRFYLYGTHFLIEIDARTLVHQLNQPASDLPGAVVNRWLAWIRLFSFDIVHVSGVKHQGPDGLSRRPIAVEDVREEESDIEDSMDADLESVEATFCGIAEAEAAEYPEDLRQVITYLQDVRKPPGMTPKDFRKLRNRAVKFLIMEGVLFRRGRVNLPPRRVVVSTAERNKVITELHDESGHRGRQGTYEKVALRYWWDGLYRDVERFVRSCEQCQKRALGKVDEPLHPTLYSALWRKVGLDIVHMPVDEGKRYLLMLRDDLSGWPEGKALATLSSKNVAALLFEWFSRYGVPAIVVCDNGPENQGLVRELRDRYNVRNVEIAAYHPQSNGMVERGHKQIVDALAKVAPDGKWVRHLPAVLWADRITTRRSTGFTPFHLVFGQECVLPIELEEGTWATIQWKKVATSEELLAVRTRQLERRPGDLEEAAAAVRRSRERNKKLFDAGRRLRKEPLLPEDMVLLYNSSLDKQWSGKLRNRWMGPYRIAEVNPERGTYKLKELDGTELKGFFPGERVKRFFPRD